MSHAKWPSSSSDRPINSQASLCSMELQTDSVGLLALVFCAVHWTSQSATAYFLLLCGFYYKHVLRLNLFCNCIWSTWTAKYCILMSRAPCCSWCSVPQIFVNTLSFVPFKSLYLTKSILCLLKKIEIMCTYFLWKTWVSYFTGYVCRINEIFFLVKWCVATKEVHSCKVSAFRIRVWLKTTKLYSVSQLMEMRFAGKY